MARTRIAIDCRAATSRTTGVGRYIQNLVVRLSKLAEFELALLVRDDMHASLRGLPNTTLIQLDEGANSSWYPHRLTWEQSRLAGYLRQARVRLFHATWNYGVPWNVPCRAVVTLHDLLPLQIPGEFGSRSARLAFLTSQYSALLRATAVITVSEASREVMRRFAPFAFRKSCAILHGIESEFRPANTRDAGSYFLYVGGVGRRKNLANLFAAYELALAADGSLPALRLTGRREVLDDEAALALSSTSEVTRSRIQFLGALADSDMPPLYQGAALLVFPSRGEGFGFPVLEAMACGTPVVTTRTGSIPEVAGECAFFVDPLSPASIAAGMSRVWRDEDLRKTMAAEGLRRAESFSWERAVAATAQVYARCLARG